MQKKIEALSLSNSPIFVNKLRAKLHGYSFLFINKRGQLLKALSSESDHFLQFNELESFTHAFLELEAKMHQKDIHIIVIRAFERGCSNHRVLYDTGIKIILSNFLRELNITEIKDPKVYGVTGECKGNISYEDLKVSSTIYLNSLPIYFNTKGTLSNQYKPIIQLVNDSNLSDLELQEIIDRYQADKATGLLNLKPGKPLKTYISKQNWILDTRWDIDVTIENPEEDNDLTHLKNNAVSSSRCNFYRATPKLESKVAGKKLEIEKSPLIFV
ncbi:Uncharacterised protein [Legionella busanensis]|uniref:Uncharacterized protein n=1 Tax=Legionella busanensis TaxID=190655 RepID=A0A378JPC4_9GAMM|nr:hypothetical protein [Legionella busanensis]STX52133.1 Uncharacterised protein [Legionella busanensis]